MVRVRKPRAQTGLRLEPEMLERLRGSERGLSNEIRDRLERTFKEDAIDPVTRELSAGLLAISEQLRQDFGSPWHGSLSAHKAFVAAVAQRIAAYAPPELLEGSAAIALFDSSSFSDPEMLGRVREIDDRQSHSYSHLKAAVERRHPSRMISRAMRAKRKRS